MTFFRFSMLKADRKADASFPKQCRHTRTPTVGSQIQLPATTVCASPTKCAPVVFQVTLAILLLIYLFLPSQTIKVVSSKASLSSMLGAQQKMMNVLSNAAHMIPRLSDHQKGVSIVAACMNRQQTLAKVLPTWLAVKGVSEIIIVDWSSDPPLRSIVNPEQDSRISLYRVNGEPSWVLSRAYNLALNSTNRPYVIRTDCDYSLKSDILEGHNLSNTERGFYSGYWELARNENEIHLNGAMVVKRDAFWSVGGYDERIQTYGWDDEDLYNRLVSNNYTKLNVSYDHVSHFRHDDDSRTQNGVKFPQVQIDINQLLLERLEQWSRFHASGCNASTYRLISQDGCGYHEMEAVSVPKALKDRVSKEEYEEASKVAMARRLADDYSVPWDVLETMDSEQREMLLRSLVNLQNKLDREKSDGNGTIIVSGRQVLRPTQARILFVHCMHGLGNRMRALGSAMSFAENSRRILVAIWEQDAHISADFESLFLPQAFVVLKKFKPQWPFKDMHLYDASWNHFKFYNYMEMEEGAKKGEVIQNYVDNHIYYKGAYIMEAPQYTWWEVDNQQLGTLRPIRSVQDALKGLEKLGLSSAIGVHIRNRTLSEDIRSISFEAEYGSKSVESMQYWRLQSTQYTFAEEMERIIREDDAKARFYVAADTTGVVDIMEQRFPGRILNTRRECDDRESDCLRFAIIDMYALSRTKELLGSNWSSYTEMAERLGGKKARLAGQDFGSGAGGTANSVEHDNCRLF